MSIKKFNTKKDFISTLLFDKINNEVFEIRLKQTQPSLFNIHFIDKNTDAGAMEGRMIVHLTPDYRAIYVQMELPGKVFIFKEEVHILPLPVLIIEADNFYYTMQHLIAISDLTVDYALT
jgi:hypothetical protein